jgi:hypothetical protein
LQQQDCLVCLHGLVERERERVLKENPIFQYFFFPTNLCFDSCDFLGDLLP